VLIDVADDEILEIEASAGVALRLGHWAVLRQAGVHPFTTTAGIIIVQTETRAGRQPPFFAVIMVNTLLGLWS
jgi:hypothetical protein